MRGWKFKTELKIQSTQHRLSSNNSPPLSRKAQQKISISANANIPLLAAKSIQKLHFSLSLSIFF
jgi:hypothetical protein